MSKCNEQAKLYTLPTADLVYKKGLKREDFKNSLEYLLSRDGFVYGCDYDWNSSWEFAENSLGDNHINFDGKKRGSYNRFQTYTDLYNIRAIGFNAVNYWILGSLQGFTFDDEGYVIGCDQNMLDNIRELCEICREIGLFLVPSLQTHGSAASWGGFNAKGESPVRVWNKYFKFVWDEKAREMYFKNGIDPVMKVFSEYQDILLCMDLTVENSTGWVSDMDIGYFQSETGTSWDNWIVFINALHDRVKMHAPDLLTSTEEAGGIEKLARMHAIKADILGANYYHAGAYIPPRELYFTGKPGYVGEYNVGDEGQDSYLGFRWGQKRHEFLSRAKQSGWIGCFLYKYCVDGGDYTFFVPGSNTFSYEHMYEWGHGFRAPILDGIAAYRKEKDEVEAPSLLANKGSDTVYWIPSRSGDKYMLERSIDGGKTFEVVAENIDANANKTENGLIKYVDNGVGEGMSYCYRVTVYTADGKSAVSKANNVELYHPTNSFAVNGDFATGDFTGWQVSGNPGKVVKIGNKFAWEMDFSKEAHDGYVRQTFAVKPKTLYTAVFKLKYAENYRGGSTEVRAYNIHDNSPMTTAAFSWFSRRPTDENGFVTAAIEFVSSSEDRELRFEMNQKPGIKGGHIYVTDIVIKEMR